MDQPFKHSQLDTNGISLHVVELGQGPPVLFCHGFPDLWRGWRGQMEAVAAAGYRALAVDMRGYGRSSAPADSLAYTPLHTVGDLVGVLDALRLLAVTIVGHDFGANVAWNAALLRPDRFTAVFAVSVPLLPLGGPSFLQEIAAGHPSYYMFDQMKPDAAARWANAAVTYPSFLYYSSGTPPPPERWNPLAGGAHMVRPGPGHPPWADAADVAYAVAEFERTGFAAPLKYYQSIQPFFDLAGGVYQGLAIKQPSFYRTGEVDALHVMRRTTAAELRRQGLTDLRGLVELPGVGHWPNREAPLAFNDALLGFLRGLS